MWVTDISDGVTRLRTPLESRWEKWWLDTTRVTFFTQWLESQSLTRVESHSMTRDPSQSHFYKIFEILMDKPSLFAHKEMSIFASVMIKIDGNFLFCLSSRAMLHYKGQVSPTCIEGDLRLCFHWGVSREQYTDTLSWWYLHILIMALVLILWPFPDTSKVIQVCQFKSKPKIILQNIMQIQKPNLV